MVSVRVRHLAGSTEVVCSAAARLRS